MPGRIFSSQLRANRLQIALLVALVVALLAACAWLGWRFGWVWSLVLLVVLASWGLALFFRLRGQEHARQALAERQAVEQWRERLLQAELKLSENDRRLKSILSLNRGLAEAEDEHALMSSALSTVTALVGALGCSFVPVDEWQQPLPAFTYGQLPEPVLNAWSTHLADHMLRERCANCQILESSPGACPLHPIQVGKALTVYCLPVHRTGKLDENLGDEARKLGVLHLYLPPGKALDHGMRQFLDGLLHQVALAYESTRLRSQEQSTLRQLQMLHTPEGDFTASLGSLLDGLVQAMEADVALIRLLPRSGERLSNLNIQRGELQGVSREEFERLVSRALNESASGEAAASSPESLPVWIALPLLGDFTVEEGKDLALNGSARGNGREGVLGMLMVALSRPYEIHPRQQAILQTVAAQVALLVENARLFRSLEYKVVIQERARLAREIHDGLAQTLAFLKLQAAQMQSYLAQGDIARLSHVLKENYQALTEAYLDTRQAIDNLRLTPQDGLEQWVDRILREFEQTAGLRVERSIEVFDPPLEPEIQAQLIRVLQEALSNVRKHARARVVRVGLRRWQGECILEISDDGMGFSAGDVPEISQHGLRGMRERAEMIGADFQIISQPHQGTTVRLVLPAISEEEPLK
jgi:two-component system nitrate/nitrite sensor histidine kinase NarX